MTRRRCPTCRDTGTLTRDGQLDACTCPAGLQVNLGDIAALTADLEITLTRQSTISGDRVGSRSSESPLPFAADAGKALAGLRKMLAGWVHELCHNPNDVPRNDPPALAAWLLRRFPALASYPAIEELTADVQTHVTAARQVIDRPADRRYLGPCETAGCVELNSQRKLVPTSLYAPPDADTVTCWQCKTSYDVTELRAKLLDVASDRLASASEISRALTSLGEPVTPGRIRVWANRGLLIAKGLDPERHPTYRIGDVQELLAKAERARDLREQRARDLREQRRTG